MESLGSRMLVLLCCLAGAGSLHAQSPDSVPPAASRIAPLIAVGGAEDDLLRMRQLLGSEDPAGYLLRSTSTLTPAPDGTGLRASLFAPELYSVWNSDLPYSNNDGSLWAGRGLSGRLRAGFQLAYGGLRLILAPEAGYSQNAGLDEHLYPEFLERQGGRLVHSVNAGRHSIDLPYRLGLEPISSVDWGQSTLALESGAVSAGLSSESQWWGPGVRNAIVLSNHAPGIPHLFLRTRAPVQTPIGSFSARWMLGRLRASPHFDSLGAPGLRSFSGVAATFQPRGQPGLVLGLARTVYAPVQGTGGVASHLADALIRWDQRYSTQELSGSEQIFSLFARWVLPEEGVELYGEWGRHELPTGPRDLLVAPEHSQGYTAGLQWVKPLGAGAALRLQTEVTNLEQSATFRSRPMGSWYASRSVPQGYTHRGQAVGAAIGPGASSQWLAGDYFLGTASGGLFLGRIRWANDAYYDRTRFAPGWAFQHDVSVFGGLRGGFDLAGARVEGSWTLGKRFNYLFQSRAWNFDTRDDSVSPITHSVTFAVSPRASR